MPVDIHVSLSGEGVTFQGAVPIKAFSWGADNAASVGTGSAGAEAGRVKFQDAVITKEVDAELSPLLFRLITTDSHLQSATFEISSQGAGASATGTKETPLLTITFSQVFITTFEQTVSAQDESPSETVQFAYGAVQLTFNKQQAPGTTPSTTSLGWDIAKNQATTTP